MTIKFTKSFLRVIFIFYLGFLINPTKIVAQNCTAPSGLNITDLSNFSATANWSLDTTVVHYRLRYKELGSTSWLFKYGVTGVSEGISGLNANSSYIWEARSFCSTDNSVSSGWSGVDTFTTTNYPVDCYNTPNGTAFIDSCGQCVGGTTGNIENYLQN